MTEGTPEKRDVTAPRPNPAGRWRCGFEQMGMACSVGPTAIGECCQTAARGACEAHGTQGCESQCSGAHNCEISKLRPLSAQVSGDDLHTCIPVKSAWFSRQTIALNLAILSGGILLSCMALPYREAAFIPGSLTESHSQILGNRLINERCSQCHPNSHPGGLGRGAALTQDDLCLKCHEGHMPDARQQSPHDLPHDILKQLRLEVATAGVSAAEPATPWAETSWVGHDRNTTTRGLLASLVGASGPVEMEITQCAMCHSEHQGPDHDLTHLADARCQACHQSTFTGFGAGHPEFKDFPYRRERRIAFDHASHATRHFAQKSESFDCKVCHVDESQVGSVGVVFRGLGYEQSCGRCHDSSIRAGQSDGWLVFQIPSIEESDASTATHGLEDWPRSARFGYDGALPLPIAWLLVGEPGCREALTRLTSDGQFAGIDPDDPEDVAAVRVIARGLRCLVRNVAEEGQVAWAAYARRSAEQTVGRELNAQEQSLIARLASGMPPDLFRQIELHWFEADSSFADGTTRQLSPLRLVGVQSQADDDLLAEDKVDAPPTDDELLLGWTETESNTTNSAANGTTDDLLLQQDEGLIDEGLLEKGLLEAGTSPSDHETNELPPLGKLTGIKHVPQGGWYLDEELLAVRYMPTGHADPLLAAWAEFSTWMESAARENESQDLPECVQASLERMVPGSCLECHLLPVARDGSALNLWADAARPLDVRTFTKFDHGPHLTLPLVRDCRYCHSIRDLPTDAAQLQPAEYTSASVNPTDTDSQRTLAEVLNQTKTETALNAHTAIREHLRSEFQNMQQSQCTACHRPGGADNGCTQCHNYHVGTAGFEWSRASH